MLVRAKHVQVRFREHLRRGEARKRLKAGPRGVVGMWTGRPCERQREGGGLGSSKHLRQGEYQWRSRRRKSFAHVRLLGNV